MAKEVSTRKLINAMERAPHLEYRGLFQRLIVVDAHKWMVEGNYDFETCRNHGGRCSFNELIAEAKLGVIEK